MTDSSKELSGLRATVRKLSPTGEDGFEGLMAAVLTDLAKISFGVAKSGSQRGKDGQSVLNAGAISFEGKLYEDRVPKTEVLSKIAEIGADDAGDTDLWILGSTGTVATQDVTVVSALGETLAIMTLILDWPATGLPPFATLLAMAPAVAASFLSSKTGSDEQEIAAQLAAIRRHAQFQDRARELNTVIQQPSLGPAYALKRNDEWLCKAFTSANRARAVFGQPLAPGDKETPGVLNRIELCQNLSKIVFGKPSEAVAAILGADGNGKSWLFAQAWMNQSPKILTVVLVPDDIKPPFSLSNLEELLISTLIVQTADSENEKSKRRWRKHFDRWKQLQDPERPQLVVFMDGLNQREAVQWTKFIDSLSLLLAELGGKLVLSCRTQFFRSRLMERLVAPVEIVDVAEWTEPELESLLAARGTSIAKLNPPVVNSLRNPRIFAVAAELFKNRTIEQFSELSTSRLLFEHIRMGASPAAEPMPIADFVRGVRGHADEIVKRLKQTEIDDLKVFDRSSGAGQSPANLSLTDQFMVTSAGRFFEEIPEDPTLYVLKDDGLPLALGLSILATARGALRNKRDVGEALAKILDPISALDNTADVLLSALVAAVIGEDTPDDIVATLVTAFLGLQNLDAARYDEFRALSRRSPTAFLTSLERALLADTVTANLSWLTQALLENRGDTNCSPVIATFLHRWLSMYSTAPERLVHFPAGRPERVKALKDRTEVVETALAALSPAEHALLGSLILEERGDFSQLSKVAFQFLAGSPLKDFGESFRNWCFAESLNGSFDTNDDFYHLIQLNCIDWAETRAAILEGAQVLRGEDVSKTGKWALVYLLRATADPSDAKEAKALVEDLTKDRKKFTGWRLIENWCATDPCDPASERPANIAVTAEKYAALDVSKLKMHRPVQGSEDHFFDGARVGLARFEPSVAVKTMRRFAADVLTRDNAGFRAAAFILDDNTAALNTAIAVQFVEKAAQVARDALTQDDKNKELFVTSQHGLSIAFPHMTGDEQLDSLVAHPKVNNILLSVCELMQASDPSRYEAALERAYGEGDTVNLFRLMVFGEYTRTRVTEKARTIVGELTESADKLVRLCALSLALRLEDPSLLRLVASNDWTASTLDSASDTFEIWAGSEVLVLAAERGFLSIEDCLGRIALTGYLSLVRRLGNDAALAVSSQIDAAISKAIDREVLTNLPDIEERILSGMRPATLNVKDKPDPNEAPAVAFARAAETGDAWYERHNRNREIVEQFERELTRDGAYLIIQSVTSELVSEIYRYHPLILRSWCDRLISLNTVALTRLHNIALLVAEAVSNENDDQAVALFERLTSSEPIVRITFERAGIPLDAVAIWRAADTRKIRELRFKRLDQARSDHDISVEVLAAILAGKHELLREYVTDRQSRPEPAYIARAVTVAGFCFDTTWTAAAIDALKYADGFLGQAHQSAKFAMDRHKWSKHWAKLMSEAASETDLWRSAVILAKIVDGRFRESDVEGDGKNNLVRRYGTTFNDLIRRRIETWNRERGKNLFGMKKPNEIFLV